jgi:DNA invertase Pin-like site-specific DNA recombinase
MARKAIPVVAYMTSSASNVGQYKDSDKRQRAAIEAFAKANGYAVDEADWFYDAAIGGADPITERPGFARMLERIAGNGVRTILVESPDRFARDLIVQMTGHDYLKKLGVDLVPTSAPDFFLEDTPTAKLIRQVLGAVAEFEKTSLVAKLKAARDRKIARGIKCGGRKTILERSPATVALAKQLHKSRTPILSLRQIADELARRGHVSSAGTAFSPMVVSSMLQVSDAAVERAIAAATLIARSGLD